ncbi:MAG: hypothetical protein HYY06_27260 [Deltaproteobacteria bacterium]|nr:hypothetical protein [Deltaproteobacteria bacterium]
MSRSESRTRHRRTNEASVASNGGAAHGAAGHRRETLPDEHSSLVGVLYHAMQGAELYAEYAMQAEQSGDADLAEFLWEVQEDEVARADRAKEFLVERLGVEDLIEELEEEDLEEQEEPKAGASRP